MIAVIDYKAGNIYSVLNALNAINADAVLTCDKNIISKSRAVIIPGVGAFGAAAHNLKHSGCFESVLQAANNNVPVLGICVGLQIMFCLSEESPQAKGLSLLEGNIEKLDCKNLKIPHIGWSRVDKIKDNRLLNGLDNEFFYFAHSYALKQSPYAIAKCSYGQEFVPALNHKNIYAVQFHPEKSGDAGLKLLSNFVEIVKSY